MSGKGRRGCKWFDFDFFFFWGKKMYCI